MENRRQGVNPHAEQSRFTLFGYSPDRGQHILLVLGECALAIGGLVWVLTMVI